MSNTEDLYRIIRVPETPLPAALTRSKEFALLSERAQKEFLGHVRYMQEAPFKLREWIDEGSPSNEMRALVLRLDLDISIHIGTPAPPQMEISAHALREVWASHRKPLVTWLAPKHAAALNMAVPRVGASLTEISAWVKEAADALTDLFDGFFKANEYDGALAYLVAIHVYMTGIKFGLGRVDMQYPR
jgi:hypothetical protein